MTVGLVLFLSAGCSGGGSQVTGGSADPGADGGLTDGGAHPDGDGGADLQDGGCTGEPAQSDATAGPVFMPPGAAPTWQDYDASYTLTVSTSSTGEVRCTAEVPNVGRTLFYRQSPRDDDVTMSVFLGDSIEDIHEVSVGIAAPRVGDGEMVPESWDATASATLTRLRVICEVDEFAGEVYDLDLDDEAIAGALSS